jgi:hypothetical protein
MGRIQQQMLGRPKPGIAVANRGLVPPPVAPMPVRQRIGKPAGYQRFKGPMMY